MDRSLEIMVFNEECLVNVCHYQELNKFYPLYNPSYDPTDVETSDMFRYIKWFKYWNPKLIEKGEVVTRFPYVNPRKDHT